MEDYRYVPTGTLNRHEISRQSLPRSASWNMLFILNIRKHNELNIAAFTYY